MTHASRLRLQCILAVLLIGAFARVPAAQTPTVTLLGYKTTVPAGWTPRTPSSSMRLAEYTIAAPDGSLGAEVIVYFFGKAQGGAVEPNLARWRAQFSTPDGSPVPEKITRDSTGAFPITIAEYSGTYARGVGAGDASQAKAGQTLVAAIAETPRGTMFAQLFGPSARVAAERDALVRFVRGLKDQ
jgi:hypothetical protein